MLTRISQSWNLHARRYATRQQHVFNRGFAKHVIGIDLGTTNSCVAIVEGMDQEPKIIENAEGARITPSVVSLAATEPVVGSSAKRNAAISPLATFYGTKRLLGKPYDDIDIQADSLNFPYKILKGENGGILVDVKGTPTPLEAISAHIIRFMKTQAETYLGEDVEKCVVSVPAYFDESQRQATKDACTIAGLECVSVINEPTAAAVAYGLDKKEGEKILVYDLGGGTFDVSLLTKGEGGSLEVLATSGNSYLGGVDFDMALMEFLKDRFFKDTKIELKEPLAMQRLKEASETAKIELTNRQQTEINLPFLSADETGPKHLNFMLTRAHYEQMVEPFIKKTMEPVDLVLQDAGMSPEEITNVVLVGGMTRMPKVQQVVRDKFSRDPIRTVNADEVVAAGAAEVAFGFSSGKRVQLMDVCALSVGIETLGGLFYRVIDRNTRLPASKEFTFTTAIDEQTVANVKVLQGEREMAKDNKLLGNLMIEDLESLPRGELKIRLNFKIDEQGMVTVEHMEGTGKDVETKAEIEFSSLTGLSDEEIEKLIKESEESYETDANSREETQISNNADQLLWSLDAFLQNSELSESLQSQITDLSNEAKASKYGKDFQDLEHQIPKLEQLVKKIHDHLKASGEPMKEEVEAKA